MDDSASTPEDTPVTVDVVLNDSDIDGDKLTVVSVTQPANGVAKVDGSGPDNTVTYTPNTDYCGQDSFMYTIEDVDGGTATATVAVTVTCGEYNASILMENGVPKNFVFSE